MKEDSDFGLFVSEFVRFFDEHNDATEEEYAEYFSKMQKKWFWTHQPYWTAKSQVADALIIAARQDRQDQGSCDIPLPLRAMRGLIRSSLPLEVKGPFARAAIKRYGLDRLDPVLREHYRR